VLALPETATDADIEGVYSVVAHEYFHNWTGNRVTVDSWFQLTLKEGLTVFRDQMFTMDHSGSAAANRIADVSVLRAHQFEEDSGPMAHPIRPESYIAMDNFYTVTVYEKGAEVVRLYHTLCGADGFRRGTDLYFDRHDGQAVSCDDFRAAIADANPAVFGGGVSDQVGLSPSLPTHALMGGVHFACAPLSAPSPAVRAVVHAAGDAGGGGDVAV
jgi:aminopeptidase N